jgi:uncharacterized RDD family membrane protein YckC
MTEGDNPYAAPQAEAGTVSQETRHYGLASPIQRFVNFVVDYLGMFLFGIVIAIPFALLWPEALDGLNGAWAERLVSLVIMLLYYLVFESWTGRTLGKLVTGTRVIDVDGGRPPPLRILWRTLARCIPFEAVSFLQNGQPGVHDRVSKTRVVRLRPSSVQRAVEDA